MWASPALVLLSRVFARRRPRRQRRRRTCRPRPETGSSIAPARSGLDFVHVNGMSGRFYMPEVLAPGVALFDYDQDGDLDVYLVQGQPLGPGAPASRAGTPLTDRLYRNDLRVERRRTRRLHFTDVTAQSGIDAARLRHGRGGGRHRQRRPARSLPDQVQRAEPAAAQQRRRHVHRHLEGERHRQRGLERVGGVRGHRSRRLAGPLRRELPALHARGPHAVHRARRARPTTARPTATSRCPIGCTATSATAPSPTSARRRRSRARSARRSASRPPTSTTTAGWTSTSPTTARRTSSG